MKRAHRFVLALLLTSLITPGLERGALAQRTASVPEVSAQAAYVYDATEDIELLSFNSAEQRAPASTVKIVTAMVVIDNAPLDTQIVVDAQDVTNPESGESSMLLVAGDIVTVDQLLFGMLLPSGNDAAQTLARHVGGLLLAGAAGDPIERFVQAMNDKVTGAGLSNTHFLSPEGLSDDDGQYTTAYDLAHLGAMAMGYDKIEEIAGTYQITLTSVGPEARVYPLVNTNQFLPGSITEFATEDVVGLKSGSTDKAGACLVLARRERGGNLVIAVVLGSEITYDDLGLIVVDGRWQDMRSVLNSVGETFAWLNPESDNDIPGLKSELAAWQVKLQNDAAIIVSPDQRTAIRYQLELKPIGPAESEAGRVVFFAGSDQIAERPLVFR